MVRRRCNGTVYSQNMDNGTVRVIAIGIILQLPMTLVLSKEHIIQITPTLRQLGYHRNIDLGEVIAEDVIDSPEACGRLCIENPDCNSIILIGNLCRMFPTSHCPVGVSL